MKAILTDSEKEFIIKNKDVMFVGTIAREIKHTPQTIERYLRLNNLPYKKRGVFPCDLTYSENLVMKLLINEEQSLNEIANKACLSKNTIKTHIENICQKYYAKGPNRITIAVIRHLKKEGLLKEGV